MSTADDLGILTSFLEDLKWVLERFVNDYIENCIGKEFKDANLIPIFRNSFPAARRALIISINRLNEPDEQLLRKLDDHGLRGESLILKIEIVNVHKRDLLKDIDHARGVRGTTSESEKSFWSRLRYGFKRFFKVANIPLESLADCIPGLGLAVEFKKSVEHVLE